MSGITRQVAAMRGKASRRIIRERTKKLLEQGIVLSQEGKIPRYDLKEKN
jgi:hypothetical protein